MNCPFYDIAIERVADQDATAIAFHDAYPVADGHTMAVTV